MAAYKPTGTIDSQGLEGRDLSHPLSAATAHSCAVDIHDSKSFAHLTFRRADLCNVIF